MKKWHRRQLEKAAVRTPSFDEDFNFELIKQPDWWTPVREGGQVMIPAKSVHEFEYVCCEYEFVARGAKTELLDDKKQYDFAYQGSRAFVARDLFVSLAGSICDTYDVVLVRGKTNKGENIIEVYRKRLFVEKRFIFCDKTYTRTGQSYIIKTSNNNLSEVLSDVCKKIDFDLCGYSYTSSPPPWEDIKVDVVQIGHVAEGEIKI